MSPDSWQAWDALAIARGRLGMADEAATAFDRALALAPAERRAEIERERGRALGGPWTMMNPETILHLHGLTKR